MRTSAFAAALSLLAFAGPTRGSAQSDDPHERLINLDMLLISKDICGFAISQEQEDAIDGEIDQLTPQLNMSNNDSDQLYTQLQDEMTRQKAEGLCAPTGAWAKLFGKLLAGLPVGAPQ